MAMDIPGRVHNGVVVLEGGPQLPEGLAVTVRTDSNRIQAFNKTKRRVQLPLIAEGTPGSIRLTSERIAEILDEEDASSGH